MNIPTNTKKRALADSPSNASKSANSLQLAAVVFHHELLVELHRNLLAERSANQLAYELGLIYAEVRRSFRSGANGFNDLHVSLGALAQNNNIINLYSA